MHTRTPSGRHPLDPKLTGRLLPTHIPSRTSKVSEKLVLLPETADEKEGLGFLDEEDEEGPPNDDEVERIRTRKGGPGDKSYAESLPKQQRTEKLARVTAYCTAQAYKMRATAEFVKETHGARTKLYDDCLYTVYHLPLLPGNDGYRVRSSPVLKSPGGKSVLDEEIERNEQREYREGYFEEDPESFSVPVQQYEDGGEVLSPQQSPDDHDRPRSNGGPGESPQHDTYSPLRPGSPNSRKSIHPNAYMFGEMFVFSYGVVVFWNFTERQEKDILADLTFSHPSSTGGNSTGFAIKPQPESDFETEEFHFEYNSSIPRPRVFNDMITLRSGDHMIKLAMSHAIAQSTKLSFFEERMSATMVEASHVPRRLALTGNLGMQRTDVVKILGTLYTTRVSVNLSSNMLDVPNFFWESEPTLHPLYIAVREYLEIKPRVMVLNERCRVFLDLAEILSDAIADRKMNHITWIIIVLIVLSIVVTVSEVFLRFGLLQREGQKNAGIVKGF